MTLNRLFTGQTPYPSVSIHWNSQSPNHAVNGEVKSTSVPFDSLMNKTISDSAGEKAVSDKDIELIKEVGFHQYQVIMNAITHIETALEEAREDFRESKDELKFTESIFEEKYPRSVAEAYRMLNDVLKQVPRKLYEDFRDTVLQYLEAGKQADDLQEEKQTDNRGLKEKMAHFDGHFRKI